MVEPETPYDHGAAVTTMIGARKASFCCTGLTLLSQALQSDLGMQSWDLEEWAVEDDACDDALVAGSGP